MHLACIFMLHELHASHCSNIQLAVFRFKYICIIALKIYHGDEARDL